MTSKADFKKLYKDSTPEQRRTRLNELGSMPEKDDDLTREHDLLATWVAEDEDQAAEAQKPE